MEHDLAEKFSAILAARVTEAIERGLQKFSNRLTYISRHGYYAAEESRILSTKVYKYLFGEDTELYKQTGICLRWDSCSMTAGTQKCTACPSLAAAALEA